MQMDVATLDLAANARQACQMQPQTDTPPSQDDLVKGHASLHWFEFFL